MTHCVCTARPHQHAMARRCSTPGSPTSRSALAVAASALRARCRDPGRRADLLPVVRQAPRRPAGARLRAEPRVASARSRGGPSRVRARGRPEHAGAVAAPVPRGDGGHARRRGALRFDGDEHRRRAVSLHVRAAQLLRGRRRPGMRRRRARRPVRGPTAVRSTWRRRRTTEPIDAIFEAAPDHLVLAGRHSRARGRRGRNAERGALESGPNEIADIGDGWRDFVCVERGRIGAAAVTLEPGASSPARRCGCGAICSVTARVPT